MTIEIRPLEPQDRSWIHQFTIEHWHSEQVIAHGTVYIPADLPGFAAFEQNVCCGLLTYIIQNQECEIVTLDSLRENRGIGSALIFAAIHAAKDAGCRRVWLITTNDNLRALSFYQKRGFKLVRVNRGAVDQARQLKPEIPMIGLDGIPIHDEIELELPLTKPA